MRHRLSTHTHSMHQQQQQQQHDDAIAFSSLSWLFLLLYNLVGFGRRLGAIGFGFFQRELQRCLVIIFRGTDEEDEDEERGGGSGDCCCCCVIGRKDIGGCGVDKAFIVYFVYVHPQTHSHTHTGRLALMAPLCRQLLWTRRYRHHCKQSIYSGSQARRTQTAEKRN